MLDASTMFANICNEMMLKFERLSAMNDRDVYNQQIYDMYLDCLILAERLLTKANQANAMIDTRIYVKTLMNGLIDGEISLMKDGSEVYNRPEHYLILAQVCAELRLKLQAAEQMAA